jgi:hypothetical protein
MRYFIQIIFFISIECQLSYYCNEICSKQQIKAKMISFLRRCRPLNRYKILWFWNMSGNYRICSNNVRGVYLLKSFWSIDWWRKYPMFYVFFNKRRGVYWNTVSIRARRLFERIRYLFKNICKASPHSEQKKYNKWRETSTARQYWNEWFDSRLQIGSILKQLIVNAIRSRYVNKEPFPLSCIITRCDVFSVCLASHFLSLGGPESFLGFSLSHSISPGKLRFLATG